MSNETSLTSWDNYVSGSFLKAVNVSSELDAFLCTAVEEYIDKQTGAKRPRLTLQRNDKEFEFDLNKVNAVFLKNSGIASPDKVVGKKLYFKKALVRNPKTNLEVESLRISKVE